MPPRLVAATLGPSLAAAAATDDELLEGAWDALEGQYRRVGASAQKRSLDFMGRIVGGLSPDKRTDYGLRQAADLDESWAWTKENLTALAKTRLYTPDLADPELGEFDPTSKVPTGLVRQAMRTAGGIKGSANLTQLNTSGEGNVWISVPDGRPPGGIATGSLIEGILRDEGGSVQGYRWVYGPADRRRTFHPHLALDGFVFADFTDPRLVIAGGFPATGHYIPGDHKGCVCDAEPIYLTPAQVDQMRREGRLAEAPTPPPPPPPEPEPTPPPEAKPLPHVAEVRALHRQVVERLGLAKRDSAAALDRLGTADQRLVSARLERHRLLDVPKLAGDAGYDEWRLEANRAVAEENLARLDAEAAKATAGTAARHVEKLEASATDLAGHLDAIEEAADAALDLGPTPNAVTVARGNVTFVGDFTDTVRADLAAKAEELAGYRAKLAEAISEDWGENRVTHFTDLVRNFERIERQSVVAVFQAEEGLAKAETELARTIRAWATGPLDVRLTIRDEAYPGGLTQKKAEAWLQARWGGETTTGKERFITLTGLDQTGANEVASAWAEMAQRYPQTSERVQLLGTSAGVSRQARAQLPAYVKVPSVKGGVIADAWNYEPARWLRLGPRMNGARSAEFAESMTRNVSTGHFPPNTANRQSILRHEFGHHLHYEAESKVGAQKVREDIAAAVERAIDRAYPTMGAKGRITDADGYLIDRSRARTLVQQRDVSKYGATKVEELVAESVSSVHANGDAASELAKDVYRIVVGYAEGADAFLV